MGNNLFNYREEYVRANLFYKSKLWNTSAADSDPELKAFGSEYRGYNMSRYLFRAFTVGTLAGFNLLYIIPRFNKIGSFAAILANVSVVGSLAMVTSPIFEGK